MKKKIKELLEQRAKLIGDARKVVDTAEGENRNLSTEENTKYDKMFSDAEALGKRARRMEDQLRAEEELGQQHGQEERNQPEGERRDVDHKKEERQAAWVKWLSEGRSALTDVEYRNLQADSDPAGGFVVPPQTFVADLIKFVDDLVFIRRLARKTTLTNAASMGFPELTNDISDGDWTSEIATGTEDSAMDFGKREFKPHPLAKRIKISNKLIRLGAIGVEQLTRERLGFKFAVTEEKAFLTGDGQGKPLGVFTQSDQGISSARNISTGNTTTAITIDGLFEAKYALKQQYWRNAQWLFHRDGVKQISKLKDADGRPLWQPSIQVGQPDLLLNFPVNMSEFSPNTFTAGLFVGMLADWSQYWIVDALDMTIQRLVELYAETNQIGLIGRMELDGAPILEEAYARVTLAP